MKQTILTLTAMLLTPLAALRAAEPIQIGSHRQLFLDDHIVERIEGLKRTMHQPQKTRKKGTASRFPRPTALKTKQFGGRKSVAVPHFRPKTLLPRAASTVN